MNLRHLTTEEKEKMKTRYSYTRDGVHNEPWNVSVAERELKNIQKQIEYARLGVFEVHERITRFLADGIGGFDEQSLIQTLSRQSYFLV